MSFLIWQVTPGEYVNPGKKKFDACSHHKRIDLQKKIHYLRFLKKHLIIRHALKNKRQIGQHIFWHEVIMFLVFTLK